MTPETLRASGLIKNTRRDVKILGMGDLTKKLTVSAHSFSTSAREKIEKAGGTVNWLRGEPKPKPKRVRKPSPTTPEPEVSSSEEEVPEVQAETVQEEEA